MSNSSAKSSSETHFLSLHGSPALSVFRLDKLHAALKKSTSKITNISTEFIHFVFSSAALSEAEQSTLKQILTYGAHTDDALQTTKNNINRYAASGDIKNNPKQKALYLVIPRIGTISPWASRATDIANNCGLDNILRIERGIAFYVENEAVLSSQEIAALKTAIHDRMTETVLNNVSDAKKLYHHAEPKPFSSVGILQGGATALNAANSNMGLALSPDEVDYLVENFSKIGRNQPMWS